MQTAEGTGTAHVPTVVAANDIPALEAALAAARVAQDEDQPAIHLANARAKVDKQRAQLAAAEAELARLEREG
jgi:hypothetical protein